MNFSVRWDRDARNTLAAVWLAARDRRAVTAAQARIDHLLATDPLGKGTPVSEGLYAIQVHPLRALYEVDDIRRAVRVVSIGELP